MSLARGRRGVPALVVALVVIVSVLSYVPAAGATGHTDPPPQADVFEVSDSVSAWDRAVLPLRADTASAAYTVPNAEWRVVDTSDNEANLNKDPLAVYGTDTEITFTFDDSLANYAGFADENVEVVRARIEESGDGTVPSSFSDALDQVTASNANENATFTEVDPSLAVGGDGTVQFSDTPSKSGHYLYFVAVNETGKDGFTVTDGEVGVDGEVTVVGMEQVVVRKGSGSVTPPSSIQPGDNATFDVDAGSSIQGTDIEQAVVLYDEDRFVDQSFVHEIDASVTSDFNLSEDSTLYSDIDEVNGVGRTADQIGALGVDFSDGTVSGPTSVGTIVDFIGEEASTDLPEVKDNSDDQDIVLDGSATVINTTHRDAEITVETFGNWSTGEYRFVYVAVGEDSGEMVTDTGTVTIEQESDDEDDSDGGGGTPGGGGAPPGGGGAPGDGDDGDGEPEPPDDGETEPPQQPVVIEPPLTRTNNTVTATVPSVAANQSVALDVSLSTATDRGGITVERLQVTPSTPARNVTTRVTTGQGPPSGTPALDRAASVGYVTADLENVTDPDTTPGTFEFTVSQSLLDETDVEPEDIVMYRFTGGEYVPVETDYMGGNRFQATTPGFSTFAVGAPPAPAADLRVTEASLGTATVTAGDSVDLSVTVQNAGGADGTATFEVTADGEVLATPEISVPANATETATVPVAIDTAGDYEVAINGTTAGTLTVESLTPTTPSTGPGTPGQGTAGPGTATPPGDSDGQDGFGGLGLVVLVLVILGLLATGVWYDRRTE